MSTKHTPGPWFHNAHPYDNQDEYVLNIEPTDETKSIEFVNSQLATVHRNTNNFSLGLYRRTKEEAEANARLIAAAPELLDALKLVAEREDLLAADQTVLRAVFEALKKAGN